MGKLTLNYDSKQEIIGFLKENNIGLKKRWGQNFLLNRGAREKIVSFLDLKAGEPVWEVGPGLGPMTEMLLRKEARVTAFEIDRGLIRLLNELFEGESSLSIVQGDVLKTWKQAREESGPPGKILGNLPYSSASAIIASFIEAELVPEKMVFTVQKELAQRITASPRNKNYSSFSIFCSFAFRTSFKGDLKPGSFFPAPDVASSIILMEPVARDIFPSDKNFFFSLIRNAFHSRRKTLMNNLLRSPPAGGKWGKELLLEALKLEGMKDNCRGEELTVEEFITLSNRIRSMV